VPYRCGVENEDTCHISRCTDPICTSLYQEDVNLLSIWLRDNHTPFSVNLTLTNYLRHRGTRLMSSALIPLGSPLQSLATDQDNLGFNNLLVGRLPKSLLALMKPHLTNLTFRGPTAETWSRKLSQEPPDHRLMIDLSSKFWPNFSGHSGTEGRPKF
jgi:hypothetical protein